MGHEHVGFGNGKERCGNWTGGEDRLWGDEFVVAAESLTVGFAEEDCGFFEGAELVEELWLGNVRFAVRQRRFFLALILWREFWEPKTFPSCSFLSIFFFLAPYSRFLREALAFFISFTASCGFFLLEFAFLVQLFFLGCLDCTLLSQVRFLPLSLDFCALKILLGGFGSRGGGFLWWGDGLGFGNFLRHESGEVHFWELCPFKGLS